MGEEFDFGTAEEPEEGHGGSERRKEPTEKGGDKAKKGKKVRTKIWLDVVKGLKTEDGPKTTNSVKHYDSGKLNHLKAKRTRRQLKLTPKQRNYGVDERQSPDKPTEKIDMCGTGRVKKCWTRGVEERGTGPNEEHKQGIETRGRVGC